MSFDPIELGEIGARLNNIEYACSLLDKADNARQSKMPVILSRTLTHEQQAAAALCGIYPGSVDIFALAHNGLKELKARRLEQSANDILED